MCVCVKVPRASLVRRVQRLRMSRSHRLSREFQSKFEFYLSVILCFQAWYLDLIDFSSVRIVLE